MNKYISTVLLATATAVCSVGAIAGSDSDKETMRKEPMNNPSSTNMKDMTNKSGSASDNDNNAMPQKSLADREKESREQEVMNKKPYKQ